MTHYTGKGDNGKTTLSSPTPLQKDDIRLCALGDVEELCAALSLARCVVTPETAASLTRLFDLLVEIRLFIRSGGMARHLPGSSSLAALEEEIRNAEPALSSNDDGAFPGGKQEASSRLLYAYTVARRAERSLAHMGKVYPARPELFRLANRAPALLLALSAKEERAAFSRETPPQRGIDNRNVSPVQNPIASGQNAPADPEKTPCAPDTEALVTAVLARLGVKKMMDLEKATSLIAKIETYAKANNKATVIAVCNADGNPIAVHAMDGAYLISFDVAIKKARTAVSVRMPTAELSALVAKGGTFQGLQNAADIITFGGGIPLFYGDTLAGGLGISGGTGEEDHALCEYGATLFRNL